MRLGSRLRIIMARRILICLTPHNLLFNGIPGGMPISARCRGARSIFTRDVDLGSESQATTFMNWGSLWIIWGFRERWWAVICGNERDGVRRGL